MTALPYSQAAENNKAPILAVLRDRFAQSVSVLEIGSGTGQHAAYFPRQLPHLFWQASDRRENLPGIRARLEQACLPNAGSPIELDVTEPVHWAGIQSPVDGVYTANTAHIMSWESVCDMFRGVASVLVCRGCFVLYGPFNRNGEYTSSSNARFDQYLHGQDPSMGIRDDRAVRQLAADHGLRFQDSVEMPANNRILVFEHSAS